MRTRLICRLTCAALLLHFVTSGLAALSPARAPLPDLDQRRDQAGAAASAGQRAAAAELRSRLPEARVEFEPLTGAPKFISAGDKFLTGASGQGNALSAAALASIGANDPHRVVKAFLREHHELFGYGPEALDAARVVREFVTPHNGLKTVVWEQQVDGLPVFEAVFSAHVTRNDELVNLASQFVPDPMAAAANGTPNRAAQLAAPDVAARRAVALAARNLGEDVTEDALTPIANAEASAGPAQRQEFQCAALAGNALAQLLWVPLDRNRLRLCWDVVLTSRARGEMFRLLVDAQSGAVLVRRGLTEYLSDTTYRVYISDSPSPFSPGHITPNAAQPPLTNRLLLTLPALSTNASPNGWMDDGVNETRGNNVDAHTDTNADNSPDLPRPQGSPSRVFDFTLDLDQSPSTYRNAAVVQLFYWNNFIHDRLYELGFTEAAGNFQNNNFGRGGFGNDAVQADAQDGSGINNANFSTPPDGLPGRMQMYLFTGPTPDRDGDLDAEVILHEYTHGLSNRRVGGGVGLSALQARGMGEGWSDFYGLALLSEAGDDPNGNYAAGGYLTYQLGGLTENYYFGIRRYPYATDLTKNPLTFKDIDPAQASNHPGVPRSPIIGNAADEVHNMGEVWCVTLWEARANLVAKYGWAIGNQLMLQLVTDGMNLSPANPNFLQARDAILQADRVNSSGANLPQLWAAFAKRGMGVSATSPNSNTTRGLQEAYDFPDDLQATPLTLTVSGPVGGPFAPNPVSLTLTNTGTNTLNWQATSATTWISISPTNGTLSPGGAATTMTVTLLDTTTNFAGGIHRAAIWVTNLASGVAQPVTLALSVVGTSMFDDFDPAIDLTQWSGFGGTVGSTVLATNYGGNVSPPNSLWFGDGGSRFATSLPLNTTLGGVISFNLRLANGGSWPWENVDDLPAEGVVLECSTNSGASWTTLDQYATPAFYNWTTVSRSIPAAARAPATLFRWRQLDHSGSSYDHWGLDNVAVVAGPTPPTIITQPQSKTVFAGEDVAFSVAAFGTEPLSYQWLFNGTNLVGATNTLLVWTNVQLSDAGTYSVFLSNNVGTLLSSNAVLTVLPPPPCALPPPALVSWWRGEGNVADFAGVNHGVLKNGAAFTNGHVGQSFVFDGNNDYVQITNNAGLDVGNQLTIECWINVDPDTPLGSRISGVVAADFYGLEIGDSSRPGVFLFISTDNGATWKMTSDGNSGGAIFSLGQWHHVAGTYDGAKLQFYLDGQPWGSPVTTSGSISPMQPGSSVSLGSEDGRTRFPFTIGTRYFKGLIDEVDIFNRALSAGEIAAIYNAGVSGKCATPIPPYILAQPASQTVWSGASATMTVVAGGTLPLGYQWAFNGTNRLNATNSTLTIPYAQFADAGDYSVTITNLYGATNSLMASLTVVSNGPCLPAPANIVAWWTGQENGNDSAGTNHGSFESGVTFTNGIVGQAFDFNPGGSGVIVPDSATLRLSSQLTVEAWIKPRTTSGDRSVLSKVGGVGGNNGYQFVLSGNVLLGQFNQPGQPWPGYQIFSSPVIAPGVWTHVAWTYDQAAMKLYVNGVCVATNTIGSHAVTISSSRLRIGSDDSGNTPFDGVIDEPTLYDRALSAGEIASVYSAGSAGKCGTPPSIASHPQGQTVFAGANVSLNAVAAGAPPLTYQWQREGTNVVGATSPQLIITNVQFSQAGNYRAIVTNFFGSASSSNAALNVNPAPPCLPPPGGLLSWWRGEGNSADHAGVNHGGLQNGADYAAGYVGQAFIFDGMNDSVNITNFLGLDVGNQLTIDCWINVDPSTPLGSRIAGVIGTDFYGLEIGDASRPGLFLFLSTDNGASWKMTSEGNGGGAIFSLGEWHHVAGTYDGAKLQLYVDGQPWGNPVAASGAISPMLPASTVTIGSEDGRSGFPFTIGTRYFKGLIDEVDIFNRALSAGEIAAIYNANVSAKCAAPVAPVIFAQPTNQTAPIGSGVTISAVAHGTPPLAYQWQFDGNNLLGATNSTLTLSSAQVSDTGAYALVVSNAVGTTVSSNAILTVFTPVCVPPPGELAHWWRAEGSGVDEAGTNAAVLQGGATYGAGKVGRSFNFTAANSYAQMAATPQWSFGTNDFSIELWAQFTALDGPRALMACDEGQGTAPKWILWLNNSQLQLHLYHSSIGVVILGSGTFIPVLNQWHHVAVTRSGSLFSFYVDGALISTATSSVAVPNVNAPLTLGQAENLFFMGGLEDEVSIYARALSAAEIGAIYNADSAGKCGNRPFILAHPQNRTTEVSSNATFSVAVTGALPLTYQWRFGSNTLTGETNAVINLTNVGFGQAGNYSVLVTNAYGSVTSAPAILSVVDTIPPTISACAPNLNLAAGPECSTFLPDLTSQVVASDASGLVTVTQDPVAGTLLGLGTSVVKFVVLDSSSNAAECMNTVTVADLTPPVIVTAVSNVLLTYDTNCQAILPDLTDTNYITVSDNCGAVSISQSLPAGTVVSAGTNTVWLTLTDAATNQTTLAIDVVVSGPPQITGQPTDLAVNLTSNATFLVSVCGAPPLAYQWQHTSTNLPSATNAMLTLPATTTNVAGPYRVIVSNAAGAITSAVATLTVRQPPVITVQPKTVAAVPGGAASFSVSTKGLEPLRYQWLRNGDPLVGRTNSVLTLNPVQLDDFTAFTVAITNADGADLSQAAMLTLAVSPVIVPGRLNLATFTLTVPTEVGPIYELEYKDDLTDPTWHHVTTFGGTGFPVPISDNGLTNARRFYRVRVR